MKKIAIIILLEVFCLNVNAQINLVPNGSFELQYGCPTSTSQVDSCVGWKSVKNTPFDFCSPDYFDTCSIYPVSIPDNLCGYQYPFQGHAYMGLFTYHWSYFYREIIGTKLLDTLDPGNLYHISMRVSRGNWTNQAYNCSASNKMGIRFTTLSYDAIDTPEINNIVQIYTDSIIEDTIAWVLLEWEYVADSAYTHLYIGNFFDDSSTDTTIISAPMGQFGTAYYFIDSVNIVCISPICLNDIIELNDKRQVVKYDPTNETIHIDLLAEDYSKLILYNSSGQIVLKSDIYKNTSIDISTLKNGFYIAVLYSAYNTLSKKIFKL